MMMRRMICGGLVGLAVLGAASVPSVGQVKISPADTKPLPFSTPLGHVETLGTGPIHVVLIPGLYVDWTVWETFMQRNAGRYTMHAITLPGFGGTGAPPIQRGQTFSSKLWISNAVGRVADLIEQKQMDHPMIIGHSIGAQIAMRVAHEHGDLVSRIVCLDTLPAMPLPGRPIDVPTSQALRNKLIDENWAPTMEKQGALTWQQAQGEFMKGQMRDLDRAAEIGDIARAVPKEIASRYFLELASQDLTDAIVEMDTPMLMIAARPSFEVMGGRPGSVPADWRAYHALSEEHDHLSFIEIPNCAHYITEDAPDQLDTAVDSFVNETPVAED